MAWTPQVLTKALTNSHGLNIDIISNEQSLIIKMNDYGDLLLSILFTSRQMIIETVICPVNNIQHQDAYESPKSTLL